MTALRLFDFAPSGNCYKVRLMLSLLAVPHEIVPVDLDAGAHKSEEFLKINPLGQVPVMVDGNVTLRDSHAVLAYLAFKYDRDNLRLDNPADAAAIVQWLCYSASEIARGPALARLIKLGIATGDLNAAQKKAKTVLGYVEAELQNKDWLVPYRWTIADVACFPYIATAGDGGIDLKTFPAIRTWIERVKGLPGYVKRI